MSDTRLRPSSNARAIGRCGVYGAAAALVLLIVSQLLMTAQFIAIASDESAVAARLETLQVELTAVYVMPLSVFARLLPPETAAPLALALAPIAWGVVASAVGWLLQRPWRRVRRST